MNLRSFFLVGISLVLGSNFLWAQRGYTPHSVLATGNWYRIAVTREGVYKVDLPFLSSLGISTAAISSSSIRFYGNGGAMLDENNAVARPDDLFENPIEVVDGGMDYSMAPIISCSMHPVLTDGFVTVPTSASGTRKIAMPILLIILSPSAERVNGSPVPQHPL